MSAFVFLLHAHDRVARDRRIPLRERSAACDLLWRLSIQAAREGTRL